MGVVKAGIILKKKNEPVRTTKPVSKVAGGQSKSQAASEPLHPGVFETPFGIFRGKMVHGF